MLKNDNDYWKLIKNINNQRLFLPNELELVSFLKKEEETYRISGEEMFKRAEEMQVNFNQLQAEYLFEWQEKIPEEWRQNFPIFPGTIRFRYLRRGSSDGEYVVPYLYWNNGWHRYFWYLKYGFGHRDRFLRPREIV